MMGTFEEAAGKVWFAEALQSEAAFREIVLGLAGEAKHQAMAGRLDAAWEMHDLFRWVEPYCHREPLATAFDHGACLFSLIFAQIAVLRHEWAAAYPLLGAAGAVLQQIDARRVRLGLDARPNSEVRWLRLRILADAKWLAPEDDRDRALPPEDMLREYLRLERQVGMYLAANRKAEPGHELRIRESLAWTCLALAKTVLRYAPADLPALVQHFNRRYGAALALAPMYFRSHPPLEGRAVYFWDWELAKLWLANTLTRPALDHLHQRRIDALMLEAEEPEPEHLRSLETEHFYMATRCEWPRLEVVGAR